MAFKISKQLRVTPQLFFLFIILSISACKDKNCSITYFPTFPINISPNNDTINILDTLVFESYNYSTLKDAQNGSNTNYSKFNFDLFVSIIKLSDTSKLLEEQLPSPTDFKIIDIIGSHYQSSSGFGINYDKSNDSIKFKFLLIPLKSSIYSISIYNIYKNNAHGGNSVKVTSTNCKEYVQDIYSVVNNSYLNRQLTVNFDTLVRPVSANFIQNWYRNNSIYYFYVKP
ncbi:MAG: hypothetical protein HQ463_02200 [Bacteroidetes bacterium]|nr:hypothetical protein [Bacteroidota bacterium]